MHHPWAEVYEDPPRLSRAQLLTPDGLEVVAACNPEAGRFALDAPEPGTYLLVLGYEAIRFETRLDLAPGVTHWSRRVELGRIGIPRRTTGFVARFQWSEPASSAGNRLSASGRVQGGWAPRSCTEIAAVDYSAVVPTGAICVEFGAPPEAEREIYESLYEHPDGPLPAPIWLDVRTAESTRHSWADRGVAPG